MSLLTVVQTVFKRLGLSSPSTVIGNSNRLVVQALALLEEGGKEVRDEYAWPQLNRETTITLVDGTAEYSLPTDLNYRLARTEWDRSNDWPLVGPMSPEDWQLYKSGLVTTPTRLLFRVKGFGAAKMTLHPTPDASNAGNTLAYEYQSLYWIRTAAGTEGSKEAFTLDTDVSLLRESLLEKELLWRFRRAQRLDFALEQEEAMTAWEREVCALKGTRTFNRMTRGPGGLVYPAAPLVPETGFGS